MNTAILSAKQYKQLLLSQLHSTVSLVRLCISKYKFNIHSVDLKTQTLQYHNTYTTQNKLTLLGYFTISTECLFCHISNFFIYFFVNFYFFCCCPKIMLHISFDIYSMPRYVCTHIPISLTNFEQYILMLHTLTCVSSFRIKICFIVSVYIYHSRGFARRLVFE